MLSSVGCQINSHFKQYEYFKPYFKQGRHFVVNVFGLNTPKRLTFHSIMVTHKI